MDDYRIPSVGAALSLSAAWMVGLAVIFGVSASGAASAGEWLIRVGLTVGAAAAAVLFLRAALDFWRPEGAAAAASVATGLAEPLVPRPSR